MTFSLFAGTPSPAFVAGLAVRKINPSSGLFDARRKITAWRKEYNEERPHTSLGYRTPH
jgi:transposase InsO family protein